MNLRITILVLIITKCLMVNAQAQPMLFNAEISTFFQEHSAEKIYLQSDRDVYVVNDTIWFKISLCNAHTKVLVTGYRNIYVELVNDSNKCVIRNLVVGYNGVASSDFMLDKHELLAGKYKIRTYTQYQRNFGSDFYYEKNILIKELLSNQIEHEQKQDSINAVVRNVVQKDIDFQVFPEGGYLSNGSKCTLAFKALASNGMSVEVSGWLKDETGTVVSDLATCHAGMGKVRFIPELGKRYYITLKEYPNFKELVPEAMDKIKMSVSLLNDSTYNIKLRDNTAMDSERNYFLISNAYGINSFFYPVKMKGVLKLMNLRKSLFQMGVNRVILADEQMRPITERLIFVDKTEHMCIDFNVSDTVCATREKIDVEFTTKVDSSFQAANVSVSALNVDQYIKLEEYPQTIQSYLLLDSELKGHVENPSYYFKDDSISTHEKLELLLLTQGWSNYVWSKYDSIKPEMIHAKEFGLEVSGRIKRLFSKKGVKEGKVTILMGNGSGFNRFNQSPTGNNGTFKFPPFLFPDTISTFFQGVNKHDWKNTEVVELKTFLDIPEDVAPFIDFSTPDEKAQQEFNKMAYQRLLDDKAYNPQNYEHMLDEVTIVKSKASTLSQNDGHNRMYSFADAVLTNDEDSPQFSNIWDFISGASAGVLVTGNEVSIRGAGEPLFLIDGTEVDKDMFGALSMQEVDKVEILKNASNLAVFGMKGGNGAIAVYTKRGEMVYKDIHQNGVRVENLRGYTLSREFYKPNYKVNKTSQKDHRATLYWNPNINVDSTGVANFSFYTSDDQSPVLIKVEGIGINGETGVGYQMINVERE